MVRADVCNGCMACISPCPTGSIDNWRTMPLARAYSIEEQLTWDELPAELTPEQLEAEGVASPQDALAQRAGRIAAAAGRARRSRLQLRAVRRHACRRGRPRMPTPTCYPPKSPTTATVVGNFNCTEAGYENQTHHIVLDFGAMPFPVLEGQSIAHHPAGHRRQRQAALRAPVLDRQPAQRRAARLQQRVAHGQARAADHQGKPVRGVASNYVCDLKVGDKVQVVGPFGNSFLMPNHPKSHIVMICTGTGSAPMRAMTEWRRRLRKSGKFEGGKLLLFFGARTQQELPYFGPLQTLPKDFIDINFAFSRTPGAAQALRAGRDARTRRRPGRAAQGRPEPLLRLRPEEHGRGRGARAARRGRGSRASTGTRSGAALKREGRLHLETY